MFSLGIRFSDLFLTAELTGSVQYISMVTDFELALCSCCRLSQFAYEGSVCMGKFEIILLHS